MRRTNYVKAFNILNINKRPNNLGNFSYYNKHLYHNESQFSSKAIISGHLLSKYTFARPVSSKPDRCQTKTDADIKTDDSSPQNKSTEKVVAKEILSRKDKLKKAVTEYGSTVIVFHVGISLISLGASYLVVSTGLDVTSFFSIIGLGEWVSNSVATNAGTFAVAYAIHKVFAPVRITITLASVPFIVRYLRQIGFLKK